MKIAYKGKRIARKKGCPVCGTRGKTEYKVAPTNTYYLPSGKKIVFRIGICVELSDSDAEFLLSLGDEFSVCT